jgi:hypothetical protein
MLMGSLSRAGGAAGEGTRRESGASRRERHDLPDAFQRPSGAEHSSFRLWIDRAGNWDRASQDVPAGRVLAGLGLA